jgi:hypothetical protein
VRSDRRLWVRQEVLRVAEGIRCGRLNNGKTEETIFEGIDLGADTQDFERPLGVEPRGMSLSGLTPAERAELEDRREAWRVKLREGKPVDIPESEEESDGEGGAGKDEEGEGGAADGGAEVRGRKGERSPLQTFQAHYIHVHVYIMTSCRYIHCTSQINQCYMYVHYGMRSSPPNNHVQVSCQWTQAGRQAVLGAVKCTRYVLAA